MTENNMNPNDMFPLGALPVIDNSVKYYKQTIPVNIYHFYLTEDISDAAKYLEMINILKNAEEHDKIFICLNNPGGSISTTIQIITAMRESRATVITSLEGQACSAATMIFLCGHQCMVNPNCSFMIHTFSEWGGGKGNEQKSRMDFNNEYFLKLFNDIYLGFLTEDEIENVLNGTDMWMDSDEVSARLESFDEFRKQKYVDIQKENAFETIASLEQYIDELMTTNGIDKADLPNSKTKASTTRKRKTTKKKTTKKTSTKK